MNWLMSYIPLLIPCSRQCLHDTASFAHVRKLFTAWMTPALRRLSHALRAREHSVHVTSWLCYLPSIPQPSVRSFCLPPTICSELYSQVFRTSLMPVHDLITDHTGDRQSPNSQVLSIKAVASTKYGVADTRNDMVRKGCQLPKVGRCQQRRSRMGGYLHSMREQGDFVALLELSSKGGLQHLVWLVMLFLDALLEQRTV